MRIVLGITGSSGAVYAVEFLKQSKADNFLIVSKWGKALLKDEMNMTEKDLAPFIKRQFPNDDLAAPLASGSNKFDAYVILPCSTSTLGKIASGIGDTLITRTAQVALKDQPFSGDLIRQAVMVGVGSGIALELLNYLALSKRKAISRISNDLEETRTEGRALQQKIREASRV